MLYSDVWLNLKGLNHTSQVLPNVDGVVGWRCMHFAYDEILTEWPLKLARDPNLHITHDMSIHEHDSCYEMCTEQANMHDTCVRGCAGHAVMRRVRQGVRGLRSREKAGWRAQYLRHR